MAGRASSGEGADPAGIRIRLFGTLELEGCPDAGSVHSSPTLMALLTYLALAEPRGTHSRDTLLGHFWPERPEKRARHSLNQALYRLRQALGEGAIVNKGAGEVGLGSTGIQCDAWSFLDTSDPETALDLFRGDVLPGFHLTGSRSFEEWLERTRLRIRRRAFDLALELADAGEVAHPLRRVRWLRRALEIQPYDQAVARGLVAALDQLGDRPGAIEEYERFRNRLARDLDMEPSSETRACIAAVRERLETPAPTSGVNPKPRAASPQRGLPRWAVPVVLGVVMTVLAVATRTDLDTPVPVASSSPVRVLVEEFDNRTGDPENDAVGRMASDWISHRLVTSGMLEAAVRSDRRPGTTAASFARAAEAGARFLVTGSIRHTADSVHYLAHIHDVAEQRLLRSVDVGEERSQGPASAIARLRERLTAELAAAADPDLPGWALGTFGPPTMDAYRHYLSGLDAFLDVESGPDHRASLEEAAHYFRQAGAPEQAFVAPLFWEMFTLDALRDHRARDSVARVIAAQRTRLAPWERALLDAGRSESRGDWGGKYRAYRRVVESAPGEEWQVRLAAAALGLRRYREAALTLAALDPDHGWLARREAYWRILVRAWHLAGDHQQELVDAERYVDRYPQSVPANLHKALGLAALGRGREAVDFVRAFARMEGPETYARMAEWLMTELRAHGQPDVATSLVFEYLDGFDRLTEAERLEGSFGVLVMGGRLGDAERISESRLHHEDPGQSLAARGELGYLAALRGDVDAARGYIEELERSNVGSPARRSFLMAIIAANLDDPERAVGLLRASYRGGLDAPLQAHTNQALDPIRTHPGFVDFVRPRG